MIKLPVLVENGIASLVQSNDIIRPVDDNHTKTELDWFLPSKKGADIQVRSIFYSDGTCAHVMERKNAVGVLTFYDDELEKIQKKVSEFNNRYGFKK